MKRYDIKLDIWIFGGGQGRNKIWTKKQPVQTGQFFPNLEKIRCFVIWKGFSGDLKDVNVCL